ncbi:MAG: O-antigen ligase family protein [Oscillospiraceae bacterium]|jgi:O-antigen ligase|nr:O-antigen ligase family protein [Oscillospiraceae bacterium]
MIQSSILNKKFQKIFSVLSCIRQYWVLAFFSSLILQVVGVYNLLPTAVDFFIFSCMASTGMLILFTQIILNSFPKINPINYFFCDNYKILLTFFWLAIFISCIFNINYCFLKNIKELIWDALSFFLVCSWHESSKNKKIILCLQKLLIFACFVLSIASIITFILEINHIFYFEKKIIHVGFIENRLFGAYYNPNMASKLAFLSLLFSLYFLIADIAKNRKFHIIAIVIELIYISLSLSRVTLVAMVIVLGIACFIFLRQHKEKKTTISFFGTVAFCNLIILFNKLINKFFSYLPIIVNKISGNRMSIKNHLEIIRLDISQSGDISNLRFRIWLSAWELFKTTPIFGTSPRGIVEYAKMVIPDTFIVKKNYLLIHNTYISAFVYTGILGAIFILTFLIKAFLEVLFFYKKKLFKSDNLYLDFLVISVLAIAIYGIFEQEIIFFNTANLLIFWLFLGEIIKCIKYENHKLI